MRTQEEILIRLNDSNSMFGFDRDVLVPCLTFKNAQPFIKSTVTEEEWTRDVLNDEKLLVHMRQYAEFAWGKALDHRGLSAGRSIEKLTEYAWLLGRDDLVQKATEMFETSYAQYGAPILKMFCEAMGFPIPDSSDAVRMMRGQPCRDGCDMGCGTGA